MAIHKYEALEATCLIVLFVRLAPNGMFPICAR